MKWILAAFCTLSICASPVHAADDCATAVKTDFGHKMWKHSGAQSIEIFATVAKKTGFNVTKILTLCESDPTYRGPLPMVVPYSVKNSDRYAVVLPRVFRNLTYGELSGTIAHELAHISLGLRKGSAPIFTIVNEQSADAIGMLWVGKAAMNEMLNAFQREIVPRSPIVLRGPYQEEIDQRRKSLAFWEE